MTKKSAPATLVNSPYLKQVWIRGYAPLRNTKVVFKQGLNIIIGPNGVGKTRFINITNQLIDWLGTPTLGIGCELILSYDQDVKVAYQQQSLGKNEKSELKSIKESELEVTASYESRKASGEDIFDALMGLDLPLYDTVVARHGTPLQNLPLVDISATLTIDGAFRMRVEPEINLPESVRQPLLVNYIFSSIRYSFIEQRRKQNKKSASALSVKEVQGEIERIITAYTDFINPILSNYSPIEKLRLSNTYQVYNNATQQEVLVKGLVFEYYLSGSWLPFEALSDGTKRMLYLISQLKMPRINFSTNDSSSASLSFFTRPEIIFLEEPELGIHPDQLQKLLSLIREVSKEHQVIVTTHSPQVLNMLTTKELDRITICELDPKKGTQFRKISPAKRAKAKSYMQNDSYLSDFWLYSNLEAE